MRVALATILFGLGVFAIGIAGGTDLLHSLAAGIGTACIVGVCLMGLAWMAEGFDV